ncbi:MAG: putative thioesterase [Jatrophihabitans sp.]|nr:putative thioesterase [Jatrophihabitans sp.]
MVFNAHYLTYCDEAMGALCAEHGLLDIAERIQLVSSTLTWQAPARWGDVVEVDARCTRLGNSSLDIAFTIRVSAGVTGGRDCASVDTTYVLTDLAGTPERLPERLRLALG